MEFVLMIILGIVIIVIVLAIIVYPKKDTFIDEVNFKGGIKSFELKISAKQKNCPPDKSDSSNYK